MDDQSMESKQEVEETTDSPAPEDETNDSSELGSDQSKSVEELQQELKEAQEARTRAENTIVKLKKQGFKSSEEVEEDKKSAELDVEALTAQIAEKVKQDLSPDLIKQADIERENRELKEILVAKESVSNAGHGPSEKEPKESKTQPSQKDLEMATKFFQGDVERYMKYKVNQPLPQGS